jgi:hypothetical protein
MKTKQKNEDQLSTPFRNRISKRVRTKRESIRQLMDDAAGELQASIILRSLREGRVPDLNEDPKNPNPEMVPDHLWIKLLQREHNKFNHN